MIPKVIHYCWFGGNPLPDSAVKYIKSWRKHCPDYSIIEWNESNFDVDCNEYCRYMYNKKRWAFLTDYVRLKVVYENGGIYMDTDVELLKSLDDLLIQKAYMGIETSNLINTGLGFGAEKWHYFVRENMAVYENMTDFSSVATCPVITTGLLQSYQDSFTYDHIITIADITLYPQEYFCPMDSHTGYIYRTENSYSIHHFDASWNPEGKEKMNERWRFYKMQKIKSMPKSVIRKIFK